MVCAVAIAVVAALVAGCGSSDGADGAPTSTANLTKVTVVLDWTPNTNHSGVFLARDTGAYERAGIRVDIVEPDASGAIVQLAAGNAQFGFSSAEQVIPVRVQGMGVTSIAAPIATNTSSLIALADRGIHRPRDLEGKVYGTYGGELDRALVDALVACDGGDPTEVRFVDIGNTDYLVGFDRKQYDVVWVFDGWDTIRMRDLAHRDVTTIALRDETDCIPNWYTPLIVANDAVIERDPDLVRRFVAATAEGYRLAANDPAAAADAIARAAPESDPELLHASATFLAPYLRGDADADAHGWGYQDPAVWSAFDDFLRGAGLAALDDVSDAYTNEFVPSP